MLRPFLKSERLSALVVTVCLGASTAGCHGVSQDSENGGSAGSSSSSGGSTSGGGGGITPPTFTYMLGGTVGGLATTTANLVIQDGLGDTLPIASNGRFVFPNGLAPGDAYTVSVQTQPGTPAQFCRVSNATGVISDFDVTNVVITCLTTGKYLFTVNPYDNSGNGSVASFTINPSTGALTAAAGSPYTPTELQPYYVAVDPTGQFIYVANSASASISTDSVGTGGVLTLDVSTASTG